MDETDIERKQAIRDKWNPIFHICFAYVITASYLIFRIEYSSASEAIGRLLNHSTFILKFLELSAFIAALGGVLISNYFRFWFAERTYLGLFTAFDHENYRLRYYKSYVFAVAFVLILEAIIYLLH